MDKKSAASLDTNAERAREQVAEQLQLALNAAHMGWWHYNPITKISKYDERFREIFTITGTDAPTKKF